MKNKTKKIKRGVELINNERNGKNILRLAKQGKFVNDKAHCKIKIKMKKDGFVVNMISTDDGSMLKQVRVWPGKKDTVDLVGLNTYIDICFTRPTLWIGTILTK